MQSRREIRITGIVQGVGFRPFIFNLARKHNLRGYVLNNTSGVFIDVEGESACLDEFMRTVANHPPPLAVIFDLQSSLVAPIGYADFTIRESKAESGEFVPISPDIATCEECRSEIFDPANRRYRYPFTNCTDCGPRFTIVRDIPYDRKFTTMASFVMCEQCQSEYENQDDRRFHAQPNACPACGPNLALLDHGGKQIEVPDVVAAACRLLREGNILAIKGLGGFHLACDALNQAAVAELRARKYREYKPFALMVQDIETARQLCHVNEEEEKLLSGTLRPIVLLQKRADCPTAQSVAPGQTCHGLMLPYTPLHHLLIKESGLVLIMTSGNISSEPIVYRDDEGLRRLQKIADYYVIHDREIHIRTDDSVTRIWRNNPTVLRRSRGYAPFPLLVPSGFETQILACGAELKNTFCLTRGNLAFLSHHIGDLENAETLMAFESGIEHFKKIFSLQPEVVAYDLHPDYLSTRYALGLADLPKIGVQHHHAHAVSCMADNGIEGEVIGVSFDGTGYGTDGRIWGSEFLVCDESRFYRAAHLEYAPLPGGDQAIREPWRIAAAYLYQVYGEEMSKLEIDFVRQLDRRKWAAIRKMIDRGINTPRTSSAGRLFDAVSALIGIRQQAYYEGQAAIELEAAAEVIEGSYPFEIVESEGELSILLTPPIQGIVGDLAGGTAAGAISTRFHTTLAEIILEVCLKIRKSHRLNRVVLSGGVFQNLRLLDRTFDLLSVSDFKVYTHHRVPTNDGGIALGQALIANARIKKGRV